MGLGNAQPLTPWEEWLWGLTDMGSKPGRVCFRPREACVWVHVSFPLQCSR